MLTYQLNKRGLCKSIRSGKIEIKMDEGHHDVKRHHVLSNGLLYRQNYTMTIA